MSVFGVALSLAAAATACSSGTAQTSSGPAQTSTGAAQTSSAAAQSGGGAATATACSSTSSQRWSAQEVEAATGTYKVQPVYSVPKDLQNCTIAFMNPGLNVPFFATWSAAMHAAAKFYGVKFVETDLNNHFEDALPQFQQIEVQHPAAVGLLTSPNEALLAATNAAHVPLITMDSTLTGDKYEIGVPNDQVGAEAGTMVATAAKEKLAGSWKGKSLVYVGISATPCPPCDERINAGLAAAQKIVDIPSSNVVITRGAGTTVDSQTKMTDILTAHPNSVFIIVPLSDEGGVGALQALQAAHRLNDAVIVLLGGDKFGRTALRDSDYAGTLLGAVDFNPYAEAWNWVATAIAAARNESYQPYTVRNVLTPANVNQFYPLPDNGA